VLSQSDSSLAVVTPAPDRIRLYRIRSPAIGLFPKNELPYTENPAALTGPGSIVLPLRTTIVSAPGVPVYSAKSLVVPTTSPPTSVAGNTTRPFRLMPMNWVLRPKRSSKSAPEVAGAGSPSLATRARDPANPPKRAVSFVVGRLFPALVRRLAKRLRPSGLKLVSCEMPELPALLIRLSPGRPGAGSDHWASTDRSAGIVPWNSAWLFAAVIVGPAMLERNRTAPSSASIGPLICDPNVVKSGIPGTAPSV
jgi:hypothetical protein